MIAKLEIRKILSLLLIVFQNKEQIKGAITEPSAKMIILSKHFN